MAFWPRVRAKRLIPRIRSWSKDSKDNSRLLAFAGYKAGMVHITGVDTRKNSKTKGEEITMPATVIECPPLALAGA